MVTRQFDTTAEPKARPAAAGRASVSETAIPERTSPAHAARNLPEHTVAAQLARSSGGHLARAGNTLLQLQRLHGNRYVQRVIGLARGQARQTPRPRTALVIQTKLVVGPAGDRYEREADHVAEAVVRSMSGQPGVARIPQLKEGESVISRNASSSVDPLGGTSIDAGIEAAIARARSGGVALAPAVRSRMETAFGSDFGAVRIHQSPGVDVLSRQLQARAFTSGSDIFFASGGYRPASSSGQALLAHELTHVVQQGAAGRIGRGPDQSAAEDRTSSPVTVRRCGRAVQRAILAIDGATDNRDAKLATRNCLANLTSHKQLPAALGKLIQHYPAGDARGRVFGPDVATPALASLAAGSSTIGPLETLYFLGHGSTTDIAGLTPSALAPQLVTAFAGYPGAFIGALKIVACYSASTMEDGKPAVSGKSYADRVRTELDTTNNPKFRPRFVEGIRGIAWADEETGQRVGYEVLGERPGKLSPLEKVYARPNTTVPISQ